jgi:hypothetical protein
VSIQTQASISFCGILLVLIIKHDLNRFLPQRAVAKIHEIAFLSKKTFFFLKRIENHSNEMSASKSNKSVSPQQRNPRSKMPIQH